MQDKDIMLNRSMRHASRATQFHCSDAASMPSQTSLSKSGTRGRRRRRGLVYSSSSLRIVAANALLLLLLSTNNVVVAFAWTSFSSQPTFHAKSSISSAFTHRFGTQLRVGTMFDENEADAAARRRGYAPLDYASQQAPGSNVFAFPSDASSSSLFPVISASLLLASNTIGASCLALPQVCVGAGVGPSMMLFLGAYLLNWVSGLCIAYVAIQAQQECNDETIQEGDSSLTVSSFRDLAQHELGATGATVVSLLSVLVNVCAFTYDVSRMGPLAKHTIESIMLPMESVMSSTFSLESLQPGLMLTWTGLLAVLVATQTNQKLSVLASVNVAVLLIAFASVLVVPATGVTLDTGGGLDAGGAMHAHAAFESMTQLSAAAETTAQLLDTTNSMWQAAPIILMAMVYQNIVPSIVKLLHYDWHKTVAAISIGSALPLVLYTSWCAKCLMANGSESAMLSGGGGMAGLVLIIFSVVTVTGSSLGSIMSLSEEISPHLNKSTAADDDETRGNGNVSPPEPTANDRYSASSVMLAVCVPLGANLIMGQGADFTPALALAGSVGSPLLYGVIPAMMLHAQHERHKQLTRTLDWNGSESKSRDNDQWPSIAKGLPLLGILSMAAVFGLEHF
ncbi:hypothetical protein MPSEU_000556300 [Mayamaea pseudoterrestris]|nr:hypothetical protein MPSEU_000556300 [Mayamaea pseudoterrestris]